MTPAAESTNGRTVVPGGHSDDTSQNPPPRRCHEQARHENFPVALRVLPPRRRRHLLALYGFARTVDDIGDTAPGDRLALLDQVSAELDRVFGSGTPPDPLYARLAATVRECRLPREPFDRLVEANRQDQVVRRYDTFGDLLEYCTLSADPVGRLVLGIFGVTDERAEALSDRICSALQVLEHCQDIAEDARAGRVYLPAEDLDRFGVTEADLLAERAGTPVRALVAFEVQRAVRLLDEGAPIVGILTGTARVAVAGYVAGGRATAQALAVAGFDVLASTPRPTRGRTAFEAVRLLTSGGAR